MQEGRTFLEHAWFRARGAHVSRKKRGFGATLDPHVGSNVDAVAEVAAKVHNPTASPTSFFASLAVAPSPLLK